LHGNQLLLRSLKVALVRVWVPPRESLITEACPKVGVSRKLLESARVSVGDSAEIEIERA